MENLKETLSQNIRNEDTEDHLASSFWAAIDVVEAFIKEGGIDPEEVKSITNDYARPNVVYDLTITWEEETVGKLTMEVVFAEGPYYKEPFLRAMMRLNLPVRPRYQHMNELNRLFSLGAYLVKCDNTVAVALNCKLSGGRVLHLGEDIHGLVQTARSALKNLVRMAGDAND